MVLLTEAEADSIIQAHLEVTGATSQSLMAVWRSLVFVALERIDLGSYRRDIIDLARDIVALWGTVQPAYTYESDHQFPFPGSEELNLRSLYQELNQQAMRVLLAAPELPPRDETEYARDLSAINEIALLVRNQLGEMDRLRLHADDTTYLTCTAGALMTVAGCCHTLLAIMLGAQFAAQFRQQYEQCVKAWMHAVVLMRPTPAGRRGH